MQLTMLKYSSFSPLFSPCYLTIVFFVVQTLEESVRDVIKNPDNYIGGLAGVYGMAATLADANAVAPLKEIVSGYLDVLYQTRPSSA